ncbi:MAG: cobaltochelatase subunit CobN [Desulfobacterales bacterium]
MKSASENNRQNRLLFPCLLLCLCFGGNVPALAGSIGLFVGDSDAYTCIHTLNLPNLPDAEIRVFTDKDMDREDFPLFVSRMDAAVVDIMQHQPSQWLLENRGRMKADVRLYAVRGSSHTQDFLDAGFLMDRTIRAYYDYTSAENLAHMLRFIAYRDLGLDIFYAPPIVPPENALYHPDAPGLFSTLSEYEKWYKSSGHYQEGKRWDLMVIFPTSAIDGKKEAVDALIREYEKKGINTVAWMRDMKEWNRTLDQLISSPPLAGNLGSITGFAFKFSSMFTVDLLPVLQKADVPVFNAQNLFFASGKEWLENPQGISPVGLALQFANPEISGLVEPTVIGVKEKVPDLAKNTGEEITAFRFIPVQAHTEMLARRAARWHALKDKANKDKTVFLMYYNHGAGKQNIGASYLNVFRSITQMIARLKAEGYRIEGEFSEETVKDLLLKSGRNIGSWAPDELDALLKAGNAAFVDMDEYKKWLAERPEDFRKRWQKDWGKGRRHKNHGQEREICHPLHPPGKSDSRTPAGAGF